MSLSLAALEIVVDEFFDSDRGSREWASDEGIELDAVVAIIEAAQRQTILMVSRGDRLDDVVADIVGQAFRLGWESGKRFGDES